MPIGPRPKPTLIPDIHSSSRFSSDALCLFQQNRRREADNPLLTRPIAVGIEGTRHSRLMIYFRLWPHSDPLSPSPSPSPSPLLRPSGSSEPYFILGERDI